MSTLLGVRALSRSASIGIGTKDVKQTRTSFVNVDSARVRRDLARHTSIGQVIASAQSRYQRDTAQVTGGGLVTPRTASVTLDVAAAQLQYNYGDAVYTLNGTAAYAGGTQAVTPDAALPNITAIGLNTSTPGTPTVVALAATAAAGLMEERFLSADFNALNAEATANFPALENAADRTWLALVWTPPAFPLTTPFGVSTTGVFTAASHPFRVNDPVWFSVLTGTTTGWTTGTVYYVNTVPSANTFTLSATPGGATIISTGTITAGTVNRQISALDVLDIRP